MGGEATGELSEVEQQLLDEESGGESRTLQVEEDVLYAIADIVWERMGDKFVGMDNKILDMRDDIAKLARAIRSTGKNVDEVASAVMEKLSVEEATNTKQHTYMGQHMSEQTSTKRFNGKKILIGVGVFALGTATGVGIATAMQKSKDKKAKALASQA